MFPKNNLDGAKGAYLSPNTPFLKAYSFPAQYSLATRPFSFSKCVITLSVCSVLPTRHHESVTRLGVSNNLNLLSNTAEKPIIDATLNFNCMKTATFLVFTQVTEFLAFKSVWTSWLYWQLCILPLDLEINK